MSQDNSVWSVSFLDLITCGLGSVLLLFDILLVLKGDLDFGNRQEGVRGGQDEAPFVELISAPPHTQLWIDSERSPWEVRGEPPARQRINHGPNFAVLYADRPPPPGTRVLLGPFRPDVRFGLQVFYNGKRGLPREGLTATAIGLLEEGRACVWPPPSTP